MVLLILWAVVTLSVSCGSNTERISPVSAVPESPATLDATPPVDSGEEPAVSCDEGQKRMQNGMREIYLDFQRSASPKSLRVLVDIDQRIRPLLESRPRYYPCGDDAGIYDPQWEEMGVELGYWVDLTYSGALLDEAHKRNPNSVLRKYTLFSAVFGKTPYHGLGVMPNINAAFNYLSEFPNGPFAKETLLTIADFHKDLFMVLRNESRDYKYDCFKRYIGKTAIVNQKKRAKRIAIDYYRKMLKLDPSNENATAMLKEVELGTVESWSFCAD